MIPKIIHQLWFTTNNLTEKYWAWRVSFMVHNPDFEFRLWSIADILKLDMPDVCRKIMEHPKVHWVLKTDVARWIILYQFGGIYADTDVECKKPLSVFLNDGSFCCKGYEQFNYNNALVGCEPNLEWILEIGIITAERLDKNLNNLDYVNDHLPEFGVSVSARMLKKCKKIYSETYFAPFKFGSEVAVRDGRREQEYPDAYCIHYWTGIDPDNGWTWETTKRKQKRPTMETVIKIGCPCYHPKVYTEDVQRTKEAVKNMPEGYKVLWDDYSDAYYCLHISRNMLLYGSRTWWKNFVPPYDYFFSLDNDNGIEAQGIIDLIKISKANGDRCIVSAAYRGRQPNTVDRLVAGYFREKDGGHEQILVKEFLSWPESRFPVEVDIVGGGACLIPKKVIMNLPAPLWQHESYALPDSEKGEMKNLCDDQSLCKAVKRAGYKVLLARVFSSHRGLTVTGPDRIEQKSIVEIKKQEVVTIVSSIPTQPLLIRKGFKIFTHDGITECVRSR